MTHREKSVVVTEVFSADTYRAQARDAVGPLRADPEDALNPEESGKPTRDGNAVDGTESTPVMRPDRGTEQACRGPLARVGRNE